MNEISIVDVGTFTIAVVALGLSLYNVYKQHYVRGPEFNLTEARGFHKFADMTDSDKVVVYFKALIQNIGDRMGYIRWDKIEIKPTKGKIIRGSPLEGKECEWHIQPGKQKQKEFSFSLVPSTDLKGAIFITKGVYSSHKGKMIEKTWETPLTGELRLLKKKERRKEVE